MALCERHHRNKCKDRDCEARAARSGRSTSSSDSGALDLTQQILNSTVYSSYDSSSSCDTSSSSSYDAGSCNP